MLANIIVSGENSGIQELCGASWVLTSDPEGSRRHLQTLQNWKGEPEIHFISWLEPSNMILDWNKDVRDHNSKGYMFPNVHCNTVYDSQT